MFSFNQRLMRDMGIMGKSQKVTADFHFQTNRQLFSSTSHIHRQNALSLLHSSFSFIPLFNWTLTLIAHLALLSHSQVTLCAASSSLVNPSTPLLTFFAHFISNPSAALSPFICVSLLPPACLSLSSTLQLSSVSTIFSPVQSGSAEWSSSTKQTVWTAHNFASFDSD